jgi:5-methylcytosine-specific restriction endonuclease McrA
MHEARRGVPWSARRAARRAAYQAWMASPAWLAARRRWRATWVATVGTEPACQVCGQPWTLRSGDLHHRSYARLGHEHFADLVPLCRPCHTRVHAVLDAIPGWRQIGRASASDTIIARLRATRAGQKGNPGEHR